MFNLHCSEPRMRPISSSETLPPIYNSLTLDYNRRSSHLVYNLILCRTHLWGKAQTIYPFIQLWSGAEQIAGKTTELTMDHWSYNHDSKKVTVTLPVALRKASWNYWTVQKGATNHSDLLVLPTHWNMSEYKTNAANVSANEKWLKGCCSGIWQVSRNSLLIKPAPTPPFPEEKLFFGAVKCLGPVLWKQA